ncbi:MAG: tripartite tricarboxylate transporter TctB family protein [Burkholderiales bacterium]|nr:tripartite tricarboxylate transporter TctB family protein [Burkholderiales bacterium]
MTARVQQIDRSEALVGAGVLAVAALLAAGALRIPGEAGYGGVGPNFLPWFVAAGLALCGVLLLRETFTGGWRAMPDAGGDGTDARADWRAFAWVSAGLLANAALITTLGFVLGCTLCYVLAVQGLARAAGEQGSARRWLRDVAWGLGLSAPVYWLFTQLLAINLPGITGTGWL